ncbi:spermidine resistance protein, partial [Ascosphaera atra]
MKRQLILIPPMLLKLLEVWFAPSPDDMVSSEPCGLRAVPVDVWKGMLDLVNCKVLSIVQGKDVDAYLLSESSMFVWPHKLILKTCGTTTLLFGLPKMLEIAALFGGFPHSSPPAGLEIASAPYRVFYSRKNYMFPEKQRGPHRSWKDEVRTLDNYFQGGSAYMIGKMNGEHWYLYVTEPHTPLTPPASPQREPIIRQLKFPHEAAGFNAGRSQHEEDDETLEILMTDLDEENAKQFYLDHASAVAKDRHCYLLEEKNETSSNFSYVSDD